MATWNYTVHYLLILFHGLISLVGLGLPIGEVLRSHSDTSPSVGLLWVSDRPVAETSTWQHTTLIRDRHPRLSRIQTHISSKQAATGLCIRPCSHWDQHIICYIGTNLFWVILSDTVIFCFFVPHTCKHYIYIYIYL
jgi:hypothetical protein